jgi:hypothetical protein
MSGNCLIVVLISPNVTASGSVQIRPIRAALTVTLGHFVQGKEALPGGFQCDSSNGSAVLVR